MALTNAMLSFFVRPVTDGTVTTGALTLSLPAGMVELAAAVLLATFGVVEATATIGVELAATGPSSVVSDSEPGVGRASLLAAQANAPNSPIIHPEVIKRR